MLYDVFMRGPNWSTVCDNRFLSVSRIMRRVKGTRLYAFMPHDISFKAIELESSHCIDIDGVSGNIEVTAFVQSDT